MSVTGHRDIRLPDDFYATPAWCTRLLLPHLQRGDVFDPCCGDGAIGKVVSETWNPSNVLGVGGWDGFQILGNEIDEGRAQAARDAGYFDQVTNSDFLIDPKFTGTGRHRLPLIITNPPFSLALEFAEKSVRVADTVAFLLRLAWLASAERAAFHKAHPCDLIILPKRPSFVKFVTCSDTTPDHTARINPADGSLPLKCGWRQAFRPEEDHPKRCPKCGAKVKVVSSDSADYGWFIWGPGRGGRIHHPTMDDVQEAIDVEEEKAKFEGAAAELDVLLRTEPEDDAGG